MTLPLTLPQCRLEGADTRSIGDREVEPAPPRVALVGEFGIRNFGNDGTLGAALTLLRRSLPEAEFVVLCSDPDEIGDRFGVRAVGMTAPPRRLPGNLLIRADRWWRRLTNGRWARRQLADCDALVISGTGLFEDSTTLPWWWMPWTLYSVTRGARRAGVPVIALCVGVSPQSTRMKRLLRGRVLRTALTSSYRDHYSVDAARALGAPAVPSDEAPDLAFALQRPERQPPRPDGAPRRVGIGVMSYRGWSGRHGDQAQSQERFVAELTRAAEAITRRGDEVRLISGEDSDVLVAQDVAARVGARRRPTDGPISVAAARDHRGLLEEASRLDAAAVTRYHNNIATLHAGLPTVAICYAEKTHALIEGFGHPESAIDIEDVDAEALVAMIDAALDWGPEWTQTCDAIAVRRAQELDALGARVAEVIRGRAARPELADTPRTADVRPAVTVGVPVYNGERYVAETIRSVQDQTFGDLEIVVSDNGSTDGTRSLVEAMAAADPRIRYVRSPTNNGLSWNFNRALEVARAPLFMWLCADDLVEPTYVERCVAALADHPDAVMAGTRVRAVDAEGAALRPLADIGAMLADPRSAQRIRAFLKAEAWDLQFGLVRTAVLRRLGGLPSMVGNDVVLGAAILRTGPGVPVEGPHLLRRFHDAQASANFDPAAGAMDLHPGAEPWVAFPSWRINASLYAVALRAGSVPERMACVREVFAGWTRPKARRLAGDVRRSGRLVGRRLAALAQG